MVDLDGVVKKIQMTSDFGLQVMILGSFDV